MKRYGNDVVVRARELRAEKYSVGSIAKQLGISTVTAFNWVKDMGIDISHSGGRNGGTHNISDETRKKMSDGWRKTAANKRKVFYDVGKKEADKILEEKDIRDFICLYWAEGFKRTRHAVSIVNTDPAIIRISARVMGRYSNRPLKYRLICSKDERETASIFWAKELGIQPGLFRFQEKIRKSKRRAEAGLVEVSAYDTAFRSRFQAWMDRVRMDW